MWCLLVAGVLCVNVVSAGGRGVVGEWWCLLVVGVPCAGVAGAHHRLRVALGQDLGHWGR